MKSFNGPENTETPPPGSAPARALGFDRRTADVHSKYKVRKNEMTHFKVASSETARDINRRIVLNLVRKHQPVSRAGLARHSGLQRSTVSAIAEQLIAEEWVTECAIGQLPRGRKPTFLNLNGKRAGIIGVDIRPVTTTFALASIDTTFLV